MASLTSFKRADPEKCSTKACVAYTWKKPISVLLVHSVVCVTAPNFGCFYTVLSIAAQIFGRFLRTFACHRFKNLISVGDRITGSLGFFHLRGAFNQECESIHKIRMN